MGDALELQLQQLQLGGVYAPGAIAVPAQHSNVYLRGLPQGVDEAALVSLFERFGEVASIRVFAPQNPSKPPFAFVKMVEVSAAEAAIQSLNGAVFSGSVLEVRLADNDMGSGSSNDRQQLDNNPPSDNIYCKNLPAGLGDAKLRKIFGLFGTVTMCRVLHPGDAGGGGGAAALVRFASVEEAAGAVRSLQGQRLLNTTQPIVVRFADGVEAKARKQAKSMDTTGMSSASSGALPHGNLTGRWSSPADQRVHELSTLPRLLMPNQMPGQQMLTGNLSYDPTSAAGSSSAPDAYLGSGQFLPIFDPTEHRPDTYTFPPPSLPVGPVVPVMDVGMLAGAPPGASALTAGSLYVKNLPPDADKLLLYELFAPFGPIMSVKVLADNQGMSNGVGLVNFSDPVCAARAVTVLHNVPFGNRNLHVTFQNTHGT